VCHFERLAEILLLGLALHLPIGCFAQSTASESPVGLLRPPSTVLREEESETGSWSVASEKSALTPWLHRGLMTRLFADQESIWKSPFGLRRSDATWALPALGGMGMLLASDSWFAKQIPG
jgi:hypothetical protein